MGSVVVVLGSWFSVSVLGLLQTLGWAIWSVFVWIPIQFRVLLEIISVICSPIMMMSSISLLMKVILNEAILNSANCRGWHNGCAFGIKGYFGGGLF